jgi:hypothetical protein
LPIRSTPSRRVTSAAVTDTSAERFWPAISGPRGRAQLLLGIQRGGLAGEHAAAHRARRAQYARDGAGVDARDADDAVADEGVVERLVGAPVGHDARGSRTM